MKVTLDKEDKNVVQLGLELEAEKATRAYETACRQLSQQMKIPGFRPGKAPRTIIEKTVGADYIKSKALEQLLPELLSEAIRTEKLDVITEPQISSCEFDLGSPLKLSARFEIRPQVELGEYKGLSIKVPQAKLPEDALSKSLSRLAQSKASLHAIPHRPVVLGDTVLIDFACHVDNKLVEGGKAESLLLEVKENNFVAGFCEQLVGKEPGNKFEINVRFPDEYRNPELAGKDANFAVEIREIRNKVVPELNDELAKSFGLSSLADLEGSLKENLEAEINQENEARVQQHLVEAIVKNAQVDIPQTMIEREKELLIGELRHHWQSNQQDWQSFSQSAEYQTMLENKRQEAHKRVLTSLVLGAVVRAENIEVSEEETALYCAELVSRYDIPLERIHKNEELKRRIMEEALTNKVVHFLTTSATIEYYPEADTAIDDSAKATAGPKEPDKEETQPILRTS